MPVLTQGSIEIVRHIFACKIGNGPNAIERQPKNLCPFGYARGLHFYGARARGMKAALLPRRARHMIDGANHACMMRGGAFGL